jgi:16S rRNA G966 N2-methylase RsmD
VGAGCHQRATGDLLELYCGNGNFSLALARNFDRVLATEIAKPSVAAAQYNIAANHIDNVQIIRMAAEEFTQAMNGVREFNRLQGIDLKSYQCETIFVDPPRSGLDSETEKMVQAYPRILYISCNPETLCQNLETLSQTHNVTRLALFDQFPYTHHMECGVLLTRSRPKNPAILPGFTRLPYSCGYASCSRSRTPSHRQNGREEVRADIRIFRAHDGAVQQHPENKAGGGQARQPTGILRF